MKRLNIAIFITIALLLASCEESGPTTEAVCGNNVCDPGETLTSCSADCSVMPNIVCGDNKCQGSENSVTCPNDCPVQPPTITCGNGKCETGEDSSNCPGDCPPSISAVCGNDECEGDETAASCPSDCTDQPLAVCGDGKCEADETFASCPKDCPEETTVSCGNGTCDTNENFTNCPADCPKPAVTVCGNNKCETGEDFSKCPNDCPISTPVAVCGNGTCESDESNVSCPADCKSALSKYSLSAFANKFISIFKPGSAKKLLLVSFMPDCSKSPQPSYWVTLNDGLDNALKKQINSLAVFNNELYAATNVGIFKFKDNKWSSTGVEQKIYLLFPAASSDLYAIGEVDTFKFTNGTWQSIIKTKHGKPTAMTEFDGQLLVSFNNVIAALYKNPEGTYEWATPDKFLDDDGDSVIISNATSFLPVKGGEEDLLIGTNTFVDHTNAVQLVKQPSGTFDVYDTTPFGTWDVKAQDFTVRKLLEIYGYYIAGTSNGVYSYSSATVNKKWQVITPLEGKALKDIIVQNSKLLATDGSGVYSLSLAGNVWKSSDLQFNSKSAAEKLQAFNSYLFVGTMTEGIQARCAP